MRRWLPRALLSLENLRRHSMRCWLAHELLHRVCRRHLMRWLVHWSLHRVCRHHSMLLWLAHGLLAQERRERSRVVLALVESRSRHRRA